MHRGPYTAGDTVPVLEVVAIIGKPDDAFVAHRVGNEADQVSKSTVTRATGITQPTEPSASSETIAMFASPRARRLASEKGVDVTRVTPTGGSGVRVAERDVIAYLASAPKATPLAEKVAAETGIDLRQVIGTGPGGKITREDVTAATPAAAALTTVPVVAALPAADVLERIPLKGVRAIIADRMGTSVHTTARVTLVTEVDATEFVGMRERLKAKVSEQWGFAPGYNDLFAQVVAKALRQFPDHECAACARRH